jgi:hypothetical protein
MKTLKIIHLIGFFVLCAAESGATAAFENLDFESANITRLIQPNTVQGVLTGFGTVSDLLPGWFLTDGQGKRKTLMNFNVFPLGGGEAVLWENANLFPTRFDEGKYSLGLYALDSLKLSQSGEVPVGMNGLMLLRDTRFTPDPLSVSMNGEVLNILNLRGSTNVVYDVSKFTGKTVDLELTVRNLQFPNGHSAVLGALVFVVPEPSIVSLGALGMVALLVTQIVSRRQRRI